VRHANAGVICPPEDPIALAQAVRKLYSMSSQQREELGQNGRQAFLAQYSRQNLVDQYEQLFLSLSGKPKQRQEREPSKH
jgi:glycosyltransferase involved in cell wall biosynthesis